MKSTILDLNSHYYCELIRKSVPKESIYKRLPDFNLGQLIPKSKRKDTYIYGWGDQDFFSIIKIIVEILKDFYLSFNRERYIICHRVIDHLPIIAISLTLGYHPIIIFHGRCDRSTNKIIYFSKYFISYIYYHLEKFNLLTRYFIQKESKDSFYGETGIVQKPAIIEQTNLKANYNKNSVPIMVSNYPERAIIPKEIFKRMIEKPKQFSIHGASNYYPIQSISRNQLSRKYKNSLAYISILKFPEVYYNLSLLDACDFGLPLICLEHRFMTEEFKNHVIVIRDFDELELTISKLKIDKIMWDKYSELSKNLLKNYFNKHTFIKTWHNLIKK